MKEKQFFGYNSKEDCNKCFPDYYLNNQDNKKTIKRINIVDDGRVYPQTSSYYEDIITIETDKYIISYGLGKVKK